MIRHSTIGWLVAALLAWAALPSPAPAQTVSSTGVDIHGFGLSPADRGFGGADAFGTPSTFGGSTYGSPFAGPGAFASCPGYSSFMFMFGSAPGRFGYGWYSDPQDARYSRNWLTPWPPSMGFWAHHYGFGYGSYVGGYGWNPWSPWSSRRTGCGGFGFGAGSPGWGHGPAYWGFGPDPWLMRSLWGRPYGPEWGQDFYPGSWRSFTPAGPPRYVESGIRPYKTGSSPGESVAAGAQRPGTRVIQSRPETGGADLRRVDPRLRKVTLEDLSRGETVTDAIRQSRARTAPRRTEIVKVPLQPVDPSTERARRAGDATLERPTRAQPRTTRPQPSPGQRATPRTQPGSTGTKSRATEPRTSTAPRAMPRPTRSAQPRPPARSTPRSPSRSGEGGAPQ